MKKDSQKWAVVLVLILFLLVLGGCGESRSPFAGTYRSVEPFAGKNFAELELKENGKGTWTLAGKTMAEFTWVVNDGKPWFYLKTGGILIATPAEGGKVLSVDTTGDWHPGCPPGSCVTFKRMQEGG
jgi:hypothetical protein